MQVHYYNKNINREIIWLSALFGTSWSSQQKIMALIIDYWLLIMVRIYWSAHFQDDNWTMLFEEGNDNKNDVGDVRVSRQSLSGGRGGNDIYFVLNQSFSHFTSLVHDALLVQ